MSIGSYIKQQKERFRQQQQKNYDADIIRRADRIEKLNQERLKLEKRADLATIEKEERTKIAAAKAASPNALQRFAGGLKTVISKAKEARGKSQKNRGNKGIMGNNSFGGSGSRGLDVGKGSSPFGSFGSKPKSRPKIKRREILIRL